MNKSSVCTYKFGPEVRNKKRYLTVEQARQAAKYISALPTTIHVFREYKCSTCHWFHIGRTDKLTGHSGIYHQSSVPEDVSVEMVDIPLGFDGPREEIIEEQQQPKVDHWRAELPKQEKQPPPEIPKEEDSDFWENKKQIKKLG